MDSVAFTIPGRISGKGRPKFARRGNFVTAFTPKKTANMEAVVRQFGAEAMRGMPPLEGPLVLEIAVSINTPRSWSKKKKAAARYVTGKPDADNVVKLIGDSLNGIVWADDSQISDLTFRRRYDDTQPEHVEVKVFPPQNEAVLLYPNDKTWIPRKVALR